MKNKKRIAYVVMILGILLIVGSLIGKIFGTFEGYKTIFGIMIGLGSGLLGASIGTIVNILLIERNPELKKKIEVEQNDERNILLYTRSKAVAFDFMAFIFPIFILIQILLDAKLINTFIIIFLYLSIYVIQIYYFYKYQKEM